MDLMDFLGFLGFFVFFFFFLIKLFSSSASSQPNHTKLVEFLIMPTYCKINFFVIVVMGHL